MTRSTNMEHVEVLREMRADHDNAGIPEYAAALDAALASLSAPAPDVAQKYNELLLAVAQKFPGESRHETALRYIRETESAEAAPFTAAQEQNNEQ